MGRPFSAVVRLSPDFKAEFDFGQQANGADEKVDFSGQTPLGPCPKCAGRVFEQAVSYVCENSVGPARTCDFRSGRVILQRPIESEQLQKLLATGRTDLLHRFISKKGRPFSAFLVRGADGRVGFEFAPRPAKVTRPVPEAATTAPAVAPRTDARKPKSRARRSAPGARKTAKKQS
jgi:DNA topoisomerase-3